MPPENEKTALTQQKHDQDAVMYARGIRNLIGARYRDAKINRELTLLQQMTEGDKDATVLYYREKLCDIARNDRTKPYQLDDHESTPAEIARALLTMNECPVARRMNDTQRLREQMVASARRALTAEIQSLKEQLAESRASHAETRELLETLQDSIEVNKEAAEDADAAAEFIVDLFDDLAEQAELTADAVLSSGNDRLMELEAGELNRLLDRWYEQREAWHDEAEAEASEADAGDDDPDDEWGYSGADDDEQDDDEADTELFVEDDF